MNLVEVPIDDCCKPDLPAGAYRVIKDGEKALNWFYFGRAVDPYKNSHDALSACVRWIQKRKDSYMLNIHLFQWK